jgi:periplasmic protein TonB
MTAAARISSGPCIFSMFSDKSGVQDRARLETFVVSMVGQALIVGLLGYFMSCVIQDNPRLAGQIPKAIRDLPLVFSGNSGGGGGDFDKLPASHGTLPKASLSDQLTPPTVIVAKEMPKLPVEPTVIVAPEVPLPQGAQLGDPMAQISKILSNGPGGLGGIGNGCCGGVGPSAGPGVGAGPPGIYPAGLRGVTIPRVIYNPEPSFSDEARKAKVQGMVTLLLVVGTDGHTYDIHLRQSLGMGLDEKAIEAVRTWLFRPATLNGQPVATQIEVEVDFHLY